MRLTADEPSPTERPNSRTVDLDLLPTIELVRVIHREDAGVPTAVARALPEVALAVDLAVAAIDAGRRMHYVGAGTSGRLAVLDAAELPPTYGDAGRRVVAHLAGGLAALERADPSAEDDAAAGARLVADVAERGDVVVGITASGRTPFVAGALRAARDHGAGTVLVSSNPSAAIAEWADVHIALDTGPEAITGSTRMKAATAAKLVLHTLSTATMVRLGHTYSNLMVGGLGRNDKLDRRRLAVLADATGAGIEACARTLERADGDVRVALVTMLTGSDVERAREALAAGGGSVRGAIATMATPD